MGSMSDEMRKVMTKWNSEPAAQPTTPTTPAAKEADDDDDQGTYRGAILEIIRRNPGITGVQLRDIVCAQFPEQSPASVSSQISGLFKNFSVRREHASNGANRHTYAYFWNSPEDAKRMRIAERRRIKSLQDRLEKARQAKAEKAKQRELEEQQESQMPLPFTEPAPVAVPEPVVVAPVALDLRSYTAMDILNAINFKQAKELYTELKGAFGG